MQVNMLAEVRVFVEKNNVTRMGVLGLTAFPQVFIIGALEVIVALLMGFPEEMFEHVF
jgi:hypothetical protein